MKFLEKEWNGKIYKLYLQKDKKSLWIHYKGQTWLWKRKSRKSKKTQEDKAPGPVLSPFPGKIQKIFVKKKDRVKKGELLLILSAMKIEYSFKASGEGEVEDICCEPGQNVPSDKELIKIKYF